MFIPGVIQFLETIKAFVQIGRKTWWIVVPQRQVSQMKLMVIIVGERSYFLRAGQNATFMWARKPYVR